MHYILLSIIIYCSGIVTYIIISNIINKIVSKNSFNYTSFEHLLITYPLSWISVIILIITTMVELLNNYYKNKYC
jgi:hypothetical protein